MNKRIVLGTVLAGIAIATLISMQVATGTTNSVQCNGQCSNQNCAAARGEPCDCQQCTFGSCTNGNCEGNCAEPNCGAKIGRTCGCGS